MTIKVYHFSCFPYPTWSSVYVVCPGTKKSITHQVEKNNLPSSFFSLLSTLSPLYSLIRHVRRSRSSRFTSALSCVWVLTPISHHRHFHLSSQFPHHRSSRRTKHSWSCNDNSVSSRSTRASCPLATMSAATPSGDVHDTPPFHHPSPRLPPHRLSPSPKRPKNTPSPHDHHPEPVSSSSSRPRSKASNIRRPESEMRRLDRHAVTSPWRCPEDQHAHAWGLSSRRREMSVPLVSSTVSHHPSCRSSLT